VLVPVERLGPVVGLVAVAGAAVLR